MRMFKLVIAFDYKNVAISEDVKPLYFMFETSKPHMISISQNTVKRPVYDLLFSQHLLMSSLLNGHTVDVFFY